ncbi:hypothetical protein Bacsa_3196 [Phocaeicola salanitronis DSM 18170]|uniref:Uncharacterized protein n=1 Tax=Phocaeicola salanitronis (strain DSM 18170 / JCM 13657 / CCUG 60908 / BL78) TaxID=667015 RepID=F0R4A3_PHOSB|nr:hypothetical protein Bacsa_3196 [Phocaeicola salanitronis DSM 18170]
MILFNKLLGYWSRIEIMADALPGKAVINDTFFE